MSFHQRICAFFFSVIFFYFPYAHSQHTTTPVDFEFEEAKHSTAPSLQHSVDQNDRDFLLHFFNKRLNEQLSHDEANQAIKLSSFDAQASDHTTDQHHQTMPNFNGQSSSAPPCGNKSEDQPEESRQHSHWRPLSSDALRGAQLQQLSAAPSFDPTSIAWFDSPINQLMRRYALSSLDSAMLTVNVTPPIGLNLSQHLVNNLSNGNESSLSHEIASHDTTSTVQTNEAPDFSSNHSFASQLGNQSVQEKFLQQMFNWPHLPQLHNSYLQQLLNQQQVINNQQSGDIRNASSSQINSNSTTTPSSILKGGGNAIVVYPPNFAYSAEDEPVNGVSSSPSGQMQTFSLNQENEEEPEEASMPRSYPRTTEIRPARSRYRHQSPAFIPEAASNSYLDYPFHSDNIRPHYRRRPLHRPHSRYNSHQIDASLPIDYEPPLRAVPHRPTMSAGFRPVQPPPPPSNDYSYSQMVQFMQNRNRRPNGRPRNSYHSHYPHISHHHHHHHPEHSYSTHNIPPLPARKPSTAFPPSSDLDRATSSMLSDHKNMRNKARPASQSQNSDSADVSGSNFNVGYGKRIIERQRSSSTSKQYDSQISSPSQPSVASGRHNSHSSTNQFRPTPMSLDVEHSDQSLDRPVNEESSLPLEPGQDSGTNDLRNSGNTYNGKPDDRPVNDLPNSGRHEDYRPEEPVVDELRHPDSSQNDRRPLSEHEESPVEEPVESGDSESDRGEKSKNDFNDHDLKNKSPSYPINGYSKHSSKSPGYMSFSGRPTRSRSRTREMAHGYPRNFKNYQIYEKYYKNSGDVSAEMADPGKFGPTRLASGSSLAPGSDDDELGALAMSAKASAMAGEFGHASHSGPSPSIGLGGFYYPYYKHGRKPSIFDNGGPGFSHIFGPPAGGIPMFDPLFDRPLLGEKLPLDSKSAHHSPFLEPQPIYDLRPMDAKLPPYLEGSKMISSPHMPLPPPHHSHLLDYKGHPMDHDKYHHHHHEPKQGNFGSWQSGLVGFLLGVVPFSMLMASVVPAMSAIGGAGAIAPLGRRRRRRRQIDDAQSDQASEFLRLATSKNARLEQIQQSPNVIRKRLHSFGKHSKLAVK